MCTICCHVIVFRKRPVVIDWKTSSRAKSSLSKAYDDPLQLAAYLGAFTHTPLYDVQVSVTSYCSQKDKPWNLGKGRMYRVTYAQRSSFVN